MKWKKFTLKTLAEAEDIVIATLAEAGIEGVEIEDKVPLTEKDKEQMFVDILPDAPDNDGIAYLNFYLEEDADVDAILPGVQEALEELRQFMDIGEASIAASETEDKDWINNWKQYFKQFYVDDLLIIPSWEEIRPEDLLHIPLLMVRRELVRNELASWFGDCYEELKIAATYNLIMNAASMVKSGIGTALCFDIGANFYDDLCFIPLVPAMETGSVLVWKKNQMFGAAASSFIRFLKNAFQAL